MSDKKIDAIKEIESKIKFVKDKCFESMHNETDSLSLISVIDEIDSMLFDINDFINDLKEVDEAN